MEVKKRSFHISPNLPTTSVPFYWDSTNLYKEHSFSNCQGMMSHSACLLKQAVHFKVNLGQLLGVFTLS